MWPGLLEAKWHSIRSTSTTPSCLQLPGLPSGVDVIFAVGVIPDDHPGQDPPGQVIRTASPGRSLGVEVFHPTVPMSLGQPTTALTAPFVIAANSFNDYVHLRYIPLLVDVDDALSVEAARGHPTPSPFSLAGGCGARS